MKLGQRLLRVRRPNGVLVRAYYSRGVRRGFRGRSSHCAIVFIGTKPPMQYGQYHSFKQAERIMVRLYGRPAR